MVIVDRNEKSAKNITFVIVKHIILLLLNFIAKTVFIKVLSKEYLGINGVFNNIALMFSFAEMGLGTAMIYSFYEPLARDDKEKCASLYQFFKKMYAAMSAVMLVAGIIIIPLVAFIIDTGIDTKQVGMYYFIYIFSTIINNMFLCRANVFIADQNQYIVTVIQLVFEAVCYILQTIFLLVCESYGAYLICGLARYIFIAVLYTIFLNKKYPYLSKSNGVSSLDKAEKHSIAVKVRSLFVYKFARILIDSSDNVIISMSVGTVFVGMYSNYEFVIAGVWSFIYAIFSAISSSVGNLLVQSKMMAKYEVYKAIELMDAWISGFCAICLFVLFQDFITLWAGTDYVIDGTTVFIIVFNFYLRSIRESTTIFREAAGLFEKYKNITVITAIINIVLSVIMGKYLGMTGVFMATAISVLVTYFWYEPYLLHKDYFNLPVFPYYRKLFKNISVTAIIGGITYTLCSNITGYSIGIFAGKCTVCIVVSNVLFLLAYGKSEEFKFLYNKMLILINKFRADGRNGEKYE